MAHVLTINAATPDDPAQFDLAVTVVQSDAGGTVEADDEFGSSVAARGGSNENDVKFAFGAPGENDDAGVVNVIEGLGGSGFQKRQGTAGVPGRFQAGDRFGEVIGFYDYFPVEDDDDWSLYVGVPNDVVNGRAGAGSVTDGRPGGPSASWSPRTPPACRERPRPGTISAPAWPITRCRRCRASSSWPSAPPVRISDRSRTPAA